MSAGPSSAEFVQLVDDLRARGAVRVSWGSYACEFAGPALSEAEADREERLAQPLHSREREELEGLRAWRQEREELGDG